MKSRLLESVAVVVAIALSACSSSQVPPGEPEGAGGSSPSSSGGAGASGAAAASGAGAGATTSTGAGGTNSAGNGGAGTGGAGAANGGNVGSGATTNAGAGGAGAGTNAGEGNGGSAGSGTTTGTGAMTGSGAATSAGAGGSLDSGGSAGAGTSAGAGGSGPRPKVTAAQGTTLVTVDTTVRHQSFEGWGTSLCWWANKVGGWDAAARNAVVDAVVNPETGLGYTIFRYNIGGGENPNHEHMGEFREMPGFSPSQGVWDWDADANQRAVLRRIVETGEAVILEAFSNSPPYWMTKSGCASGSADGSNNLEDDAYDDFADYLTEVVAHYRDTYGIVFRTLEPLNEPNANWWKSNGSQEGCHFSPSNQERILREVAAKLAEKGLTDTTVSASDENSMDDAYDNMRAFSAETLDVISQMNVHSYAGSKRAEVRQLAASKGKRLWQSESGPLGQSINGDIEAALFMAGRIIQDLRDLQPEAWLDWQVADPSRSWASLWLDDAAQTFVPLKRFYMHAGFSRFIRPGAVFVDIDHRDMVAALSADSQSVTIVVRNGDTMGSKGFTFDLTALPSVGAAVAAYRTSRTENLATLDPLPIEDWSFVATIPAFSVTTFVVPLQ